MKTTVAFVCFVVLSTLICSGNTSPLLPVDPTVHPCDDFFQYACGVWLKDTPLPSDLPVVDKSFSSIVDDNDKVLLDIVNSNKPMIGEFYKSCMDLEAIESLGTQPILANFEKFGKVATIDALFASTFELHQLGVPSLFSFSAGPDAIKPLVNIGQLDQAGAFALPDLSLYTDDNVTSLYKKHIANMFTLMNVSDAANVAEKVFGLEKALANITLSPASIRDPYSVYHPMNQTELANMFPWNSYFKGTYKGEVNVDEPAYFTALPKVLQQTEASTYGLYLQWQYLHAMASMLPKRFVDENFDFFGKVLEGEQVPRPRDSKCVASTDANLGGILGKYYVEKKFTGDSQKLALDMLTRVENAFHGIVDGLSWMDPITKAAAIDKLHMVVQRIGYPSEWKNYTGYSLSPGKFLESVVDMNTFNFAGMLSSLGQPVDRKLWQMTADTVNAYYDPTSNSINFPAGIMQEPFFNVEQDIAQNYGGMAMVMGHELTHGFDDQGRMYDGNGALKNWWQNSTAKAFEAKTTCLAAQYSTFEILPGVFVNGNLTNGENIADNGGIRNAYYAYASKIGEQGMHMPNPTYPAYTNAQTFFLAFGQAWCEKGTPAHYRQMVKTDPHSPAKFRVIGSLSNFDEFSKAFQCPLGTPMNPNHKCVVWG